MPVYEYFCSDCHTKFDALRPMSRADEAIACEMCGGPHTARVLSMFAFKGGDGASVRRSSGGCSSCSGGSCSSCGH
jgi:putative FmdB family regulatory protein